jgi:hypothetical protein
MKSCFSLFIAIFLLTANSQAETLTKSEYADAEKYIIDSATDWAESMVTGDVSRRKVYFAEDFLGTGTNGERYDKASRTRETGPSKVFASNTINEISVKFFGETAIAYGSETWVKQDGSTGKYVWTDIWIRRNGNWQLVAAQDNEVPVDSES